VVERAVVERAVVERAVVERPVVERPVWWSPVEVARRGGGARGADARVRAPNRGRRVRILHLFANWKWTGPAEPALNVAWKQSGAHEVLFLSGSSPDGQPSRIAPHVLDRGVATREGFTLSKHARLRANRADVARLSALLEEFRPDIVHAHLDNDHRIASHAVARTRIGRLVRTAYDPDGLPCTLRMRHVARRGLDGLIVTSRSGFERTLAGYGGSARTLSVDGHPRPLVLIEGGIDLSRFDPSRVDRQAARAKLGLVPGDVAVGIVARVQAHRRFELLIEAHARVVAEHPGLRLVVIGRGTQIRQLLLDPVEQRGLGGSVLTTGYLAGEEYPAALCALDACLFLVPGSDGTCRALREQTAMGLPALVTPRPPLPDIVEEGSSGFVVQESVEGLAGGLRRLVADRDLRARLREGALDAARRRFDLDRQAAAVNDFYGLVLRERPALAR
jgi:glycosyltransferase involved in cell wall biosynthesis